MTRARTCIAMQPCGQPRRPCATLQPLAICSAHMNRPGHRSSGEQGEDSVLHAQRCPCIGQGYGKANKAVAAMGGLMECRVAQRLMCVPGQSSCGCHVHDARRWPRTRPRAPQRSSSSATPGCRAAAPSPGLASPTSVMQPTLPARPATTRLSSVPRCLRFQISCAQPWRQARRRGKAYQRRCIRRPHVCNCTGAGTPAWLLRCGCFEPSMVNAATRALCGTAYSRPTQA